MLIIIIVAVYFGGRGNQRKPPLPAASHLLTLSYSYIQYIPCHGGRNQLFNFNGDCIGRCKSNYYWYMITATMAHTTSLTPPPLFTEVPVQSQESQHHVFVC